MEKLINEPFYLLPPLVTFVANLILVLIVLRGTRRSFTKWLFCALLLSLGLWGLFLFAMRASPDVHHALPWDKAVAVTFYFSFVLYYHFTLAYTKNSGQRRILSVAYLLLIFFIALAPTNLIIERMRVASYGYAPVIGPLTIPVSLGSIFLMIGGGYNLIRRYIASLSQEERTHLVYLVIAIVFPLTGALLDALSDLPPMGIWGVLVFCFLSTVSIIKYHLLDIRIVVRKGLAFLLVSAAIAIPYVGLIYVLSGIFRQTAILWWAQIIIVLLLAIILRPLYSQIQQFVDRAFYRDRYNYLRALERFSRETQSVTNLEELASTMIKLVKGALRVSSGYLLIFSEHRHGFVAMSSAESNSLPSGVVLRGNSPLARWLEHNKEILSSDQLDILPQLQSFSLREKNYLQLMGAHLYVPIITREGRLSGILVLEEKLSQQSYSDEDRRLLTAVTNQMAIALENARLYQETRRSEEQLREREEEYRELAESITDIFFAMDEKLRYTYWNKASEEFTGVSTKDALGKHLHDIFPDIEGTKRAEQLYLKVLETKQPQHFINEYPMKGKDFVFEITAYPSKDGLSVLARDITERKQAEEREKKLQQELSLSSRLASIGQLAAGVAHEINNPLTTILGFSQRVLRKSTDARIRQDLQKVYEEACRTAKVVENLRTFARHSEPKKELVNINDILQKTLEMRAYELKTGNIEVITDITPGLPQLMVDSQQLQQVFLNIIMNAEQAMSETNRGGKLVIEAQASEGCIRITFTDNGPGVPKENLHKLFDPFFTTRGEKGGTGLGLSICHGIVAEHGGKIYAKSKLEKGTTFFIELPLGN